MNELSWEGILCILVIVCGILMLGYRLKTDPEPGWENRNDKE